MQVFPMLLLLSSKEFALKNWISHWKPKLLTDKVTSMATHLMFPLFWVIHDTLNVLDWAFFLSFPCRLQSALPQSVSCMSLDPEIPDLSHVPSEYNHDLQAVFTKQPALSRPRLHPPIMIAPSTSCTSILQPPLQA